MQISATLLLLLLLIFSFLSTIHCFAPSPAPESGLKLPSLQQFPPSPSPAPALSFDYSFPAPAPVTVPEIGKGDGQSSLDDLGSPPREPVSEQEGGSETLKWCAVREEYDDCQELLNILDQSDGHTWKCVKRDTKQECLDSIKRGEADLVNLEAGLAYTAFINYSMKAIANEVYCQNGYTYEAVAVVPRKFCNEREQLSMNLKNFKGSKSCHGGYSTAAGWNYPINHLISESSLDRSTNKTDQTNDQEIAGSFFSAVCAPSDFAGVGMCSGCGNENGSCHPNSLYFGDSGALRCLMEELGDIAFVKADTVLMYSKEGPYNQSWSTKSIRDFMYLCPQGGCREINGYPGSCSFGKVPGNVIMARNSFPNKKRLFVLQMLTNATMISSLYTAKTGRSGLFSPSTEKLVNVKKLTRSYLGESASISQSIHEINRPKLQVIARPPTSLSDDASSSSSRLYGSFRVALFSILMSLYSTNVYVL